VPPRGATIDVLQQLVTVGSGSTANASQGATSRLSLLGVLQARHFVEKNSDHCDAKNLKKKNSEEDIVQRNKKQSLFTKQKILVPQVEARSPMRLQVDTRTT
jgi:hypothetical protein